MDLIRDMIGTRIILMNGDEKDCFLVMEALVSFCLKKGYTICEENLENEPPKWLHAECPLIHLFYYGMTDYITDPKDNGDRSLHVVFKNEYSVVFQPLSSMNR